MNQPTPIRHGDWRVINGELVDFSHTPPAAQPVAEPAPLAPTKPVPRVSGARNRSKKR